MNSKNKNIKIYISTFGRKVLRLKNSYPVEVGADIRNNYIYELKDNTGDNISLQNPYYGELTGLYWIWKNEKFNEDDIIGYCHYNKAIGITNREIKKFLNLNNNGWIVTHKFLIPKHPRKAQILALEKVLSTMYEKKYYDTWKLLYDEDGASKIGMNPAQLFITTYGEFDKYCSFLFSVLESVRCILGDVEDVPYYKRYCAFIGERLLTTYILANKREVLEKNTRYAGIIYNTIKVFTRKLKWIKKTRIYAKLKKLWGYKSSYK